MYNKLVTHTVLRERDDKEGWLRMGRMVRVEGTVEEPYHGPEGRVKRGPGSRGVGDTKGQFRE